MGLIILPAAGGISQIDPIGGLITRAGKPLTGIRMTEPSLLIISMLDSSKDVGDSNFKNQEVECYQHIMFLYPFWAKQG